MIQQYFLFYLIKENFCKLRDNLLLYGNQIDQKCLSCHQFTHSILDCPLVHLSLDKDFLLKKNNHNVIQKERDSYSRKQYKFKSLTGNNEARFLQRKIRIDIVQDYKPNYQEILEDCLYETDQQFLEKTPIIKFNLQDGIEVLIQSEESEDDDLELEKDLEEVRSNGQNPLQSNIQTIGNQIDYVQMNSIKSNSQIKNHIPNQYNNQNTINNNSNVQIQKSTQQAEYSSQRQTSMSRRLTQNGGYAQQSKQIQSLKDQNNQPIIQQQQQMYTQHSISSMTELQLQPQQSQTIMQQIQYINQHGQQQAQQHQQNIQNLQGISSNIQFFAAPSPPNIPINSSNIHIGGSAIISMQSQLQDKQIQNHSRIHNNYLLNIDPNEVYQPSQISKRSQQQKNINNQSLDDSRSVVSSRSAKSAGIKKDFDKQDSLIQKPQEEPQNKQRLSNNNNNNNNTIYVIMDFDIRKDYEFYFPQNNLQAILDKIKKKAEVKLLGTLNVALNIGNLQRRKVNKTPNQNLRVMRSSSRVNYRPSHNVSLSSSQIILDAQSHIPVQQTPSKFRDTIVNSPYSRQPTYNNNNNNNNNINNNS